MASGWIPAGISVFVPVGGEMLGMCIILNVSG